MALSLFVGTEGYLDDVELKKISAFEHALHAYFHKQYGDLVKQINEKPDYSEEIIAKFKQIVEEFKATQVY